MRRRIEEKEMHRGIGLRVIPFFILLIISSGVEAFGQELPEEVLDYITLLSPDERDREAMMIACEEAMLSPIDINTIDSMKLSQVPFLTDYQIVSIWEYRKNYGDIVSAMELSLISGLNEVVVSRILPFIYISEDFFPEVRRRIYNDLLLRGGAYYVKEEEQDPHHIYARYRFRYGDMFQAGFTAECDRGEIGVEGAKYPDFLSLHIAAKEIYLDKRKNMLLHSAVLGDFSARFGQGLVIWNSFSMSPSTPSSVFRKEGKLLPYTSSDENNFYRGVGLSLELYKDFSISLLYSNASLDARVEGDAYLSLGTTGIHNTVSSIAGRDALRESVIAANFSYKWRSLKLGATYATYAYNKENAREVKYYNEFQMYNGWWSNVSVDFLWSLPGVRMFGELAFDKKWNYAALLGIILSKYEGLEASLFLRSYSPYYIGTHAGAYSSLSSVSNQTGVGLNLKYIINRELFLTFTGDYAYHSKPRYRISEASMDWEADVRLDYTFKRREFGEHQAYVVMQVKWDNYLERSRWGLRANYFYKWNSGWKVEGRAEVSYISAELGRLVYAGGGYVSRSGKWEVVARATAFHVDSWEGRIYAYERDLPGSFSVPFYKERGLDFYLYGKIELCRFAKLYLKVGSKRVKAQLSFKF